jgi:hypothetical protein
MSRDLFTRLKQRSVISGEWSEKSFDFLTTDH